MKFPKKRTLKPWKVEIPSQTGNSYRSAGRFTDQQSAMATALDHAQSCKIVRITGPDGLFANWLDGVFMDGNLREAAIGKQHVIPPRHKINQIFRILRREYQRDRTIRELLVGMAQQCTKSKLKS